ncbi:MAG: lysozyme inhibitor LprI family protein [Verrucomicrobiales bacterium]
MKDRFCWVIWLVTALWADGESVAERVFERDDAKLNQLYQELRQTLPEERFAELRSDQRAWIDYRDFFAEAAVAQLGEGEGEAKREGAYWEAMAELTRGRMAILEGWKATEAERTWAGRYRDGYGGELVLREEEGALRFEIAVVRGPTFHTGELEGKAERNGFLARFSDGGAEHSDGKKTWVDFEVLDGARVRVTGIHTHPYHGVRAFFDGVYVRVER